MSESPIYDAGAVYRRDLMEQSAPGNIPASLMNRHKANMVAAIVGNPRELVANMPGFSPRVAAWHAFDLEKRIAEVAKITDVDEIKALLAIEPVNAVLDKLVFRKKELDPDPTR